MENNHMADAHAEKIILALENFQMPAYAEIPDVGLYLKQVVKYINGYLDPVLSESLTISMVSNYVKQKLISNPVHKMYLRDQIAFLFYISISKCVLSLDEIRFLLQISQKKHTAEYAYELFRSQLEAALHHIVREGDPIPAAGSEDSEERILLRNTVITISHKIYMDQYFYYSQLIEKEREQSNTAK
jgi:hypothetical protein